MFLWCLCLRYGHLASLTIVLKDSLKSIPGFGWAMQMFLFVFLARNDRVKDLRHIKRLLGYCVDKGEVPPTLLLFPEGTNISRENLEKAHRFAETHGLPKYNYVLHPKISGWVESVTALRSRIVAVYDVTIAYIDFLPGERPSEASMFRGRFPKEVHMKLSRHPISTIPANEQRLGQWCKDRFSLKEDQLNFFYEHRHFKEAQPENEVPCHETEGAVMRQYISKTFRLTLMFWTLLCAFFAYGLLFWTWFRIYFLIVCTLFVLLTRLAGGIDMIELNIHGRNKKED